MDDNTAALIFWVVLLMFVSGLIGLVVWLMSRRNTTQVIIRQEPEQWNQLPQQSQPSNSPPAPSANPQVVDAPAPQAPPSDRRQVSYRELLQEESRDSDSTSERLH